MQTLYITCFIHQYVHSINYMYKKHDGLPEKMAKHVNSLSLIAFQHSNIQIVGKYLRQATCEK